MSPFSLLKAIVFFVFYATSFFAVSVDSLRAQEQDPITIAFAHEDAGRWSQAATSYRKLLSEGLSQNDNEDLVAVAILGLERVWHQSSMRDSVLPMINDVLRIRPTDAVARSVQFRSLSKASLHSELRDAYENWKSHTGVSDIGPTREYVRTLLAMSRALLADTILSDAARVGIDTSQLLSEMAQIHAEVGRWTEAASTWLLVVNSDGWLETAASFSLANAPDSSRQIIREKLLVEPATLSGRRLLSALEIQWGDMQLAWDALSQLSYSDSTRAAWSSFATDAEAMEQWSVARLAWLAVYSNAGDTASGLRVAFTSLETGDASGALKYVAEVSKRMSEAHYAESLLAIEVRALGLLGRAAEADSIVMKYWSFLSDESKILIAEPLSAAWLRAGNLEMAKRAWAMSDGLENDRISGWFALYEGKLSEARKLLIRSAARDAQLTDALAILARVRDSTNTELGRAFLLLASNDTVGATNTLEAVADKHIEAAASIFALAARLSERLENNERALINWSAIMDRFPDSPEMAEALLQSARIYAEVSNTERAIELYETLLIDHSESAFTPQARRELDRLKGRAHREIM